jgi:peptide/nickel transport system substrate-binding protein
MITRRRFLTNSSALAAASLGAAEALAQGGGLAQSGLVGNLEGSQVVTDAAAIPKSFKEAPELAELVKQGKLPPVEKRLPSEPLVLKPLKQTGRYGGTWRRGFVGPGDGENGNRINASDKLLFWDYTGNKIIPSIAKNDSRHATQGHEVVGRSALLG